MKLDIPCDDKTSRALLEEFKACCQKGWYFETLRWSDDGDMFYKFFLLDLSEQEELDGRKFVRYFGWIEAGEADGVINVKAAGELESLVASELQETLISRFHDDVVVPVCKRHNVRARLT